MAAAGSPKGDVVHGQQVASWKTPPTDLDEIIEHVDLRRIYRRPVIFDLRRSIAAAHV